MARERFAEEFKSEAIRKVVERGDSVSLGINVKRFKKYFYTFDS